MGVQVKPYYLIPLHQKVASRDAGSTSSCSMSANNKVIRSVITISKFTKVIRLASRGVMIHGEKIYILIVRRCMTNEARALVVGFGKMHDARTGFIWYKHLIYNIIQPYLEFFYERTSQKGNLSLPLLGENLIPWSPE